MECHALGWRNDQQAVMVVYQATWGNSQVSAALQAPLPGRAGAHASTLERVLLPVLFLMQVLPGLQS